MSKPAVLGYILTDRTGRYYWAGPGLRLIGQSLQLDGLPCWETHQQAAKAALAIQKAIGLECRVTQVRLH